MAAAEYKESAGVADLSGHLFDPPKTSNDSSTVRYRGPPTTVRYVICTVLQIIVCVIHIIVCVIQIIIRVIQ